MNNLLYYYLIIVLKQQVTVYQNRKPIDKTQATNNTVENCAYWKVTVD